MAGPRDAGDMNLSRLLRHLLSPHGLSSWRVRRAFSPSALTRIEQAIARSEAGHRGQIRFAVELALELGQLLRGMSARERALDVFSELKAWDTQDNNGVLIYLLLADYDVEIIADRGIDAKLDAAVWESICREMESEFWRGQFEQGVCSGIERVAGLLATHYPGANNAANELPDRPAICLTAVLVVEVFVRQVSHGQRDQQAENDDDRVHRNVGLDHHGIDAEEHQDREILIEILHRDRMSRAHQEVAAVLQQGIHGHDEVASHCANRHQQDDRDAPVGHEYHGDNQKPHRNANRQYANRALERNKLCRQYRSQCDANGDNGGKLGGCFQTEIQCY